MTELVKKAVYVQKIEGVWCGYMPLKKSGMAIDGKHNEPLGDFIARVNNDLAEINVHPVFKCVQNYGLESHLRHVQEIIRRFNDGKEL